MSFAPGETKPISFTLPFASSFLIKAAVSFAQDGIVFLEKETTSFINYSDNTCQVLLQLTEAESLRLRSVKKSVVVVNVITTEGQRLCSSPLDFDIGLQLNYNILNKGDE